MKRDILSKLRDEFSEPITSERQVVYILAEIRKLMELEATRASTTAVASDKYFALKFYCDWAVHAQLYFAGAQRIVERFDRYQRFIDDMEAGKPSDGTDPTFLIELNDCLQLTKFRNQLRDYLTDQALDSSVANDDVEWTNFLTDYSRVIEDAPLISEAKGLGLVDSVTVKVLDERPPGVGRHRLALGWTWISKKTQLSCNIVRFF